MMNWLNVNGKSEGVAKHHCAQWDRAVEEGRMFGKTEGKQCGDQHEGVAESSIARTTPSHMEMRKQFHKELDST